jgi:putative transcriptional regulator
MKKVVVNLRELLIERGIEQKQFAEMANLTERTVSELCNNKTKRIPKDVLEKIVAVLDINDINKIISIKDEETGQ